MVFIPPSDMTRGATVGCNRFGVLCEVMLALEDFSDRLHWFLESNTILLDWLEEWSKCTAAASGLLTASPSPCPSLTELMRVIAVVLGAKERTFIFEKKKKVKNHLGRQI